jgi:23S rRNA G2445 N2-methylase RlmL
LTTPAARPLAEAVADPGYTPGRADLPAVIDLLAAAEEDVAETAEKALLRAGAPAVAPLRASLSAAVAPQRARIVRVLGRLALADVALRPTVAADLICHLADADPRARRQAIVALGKLAEPVATAALVEHAARETSTPHLRSLVEALGKCGDAAALAWLDTLENPDPELQRLRARAQLMLRRSLDRDDSTAAIDDDAVAATPRDILATCRPGLEDILIKSLDPWAPSVVAPGRVLLRSAGPLRALGRVRTLQTLGFPLPRVRIAAGPDALVAALTAALTGAEARKIFETWSKGQVRYRLAWARGGHRRAVVWRVAEAVARLRPELVNDPTASPWEVVVDDAGGMLQVELRPRWDDRRFAYRVGDVPAASHPTIAAALAQLAGVRDDDVVWDPFVGSGLELVERGLLGAYARLVGTDLDAKALQTAAANLAAAGLERAELVAADATTHDPGGVTLVITNPPMGRRVHRGDVAPLLTGFLAHVGGILRPGGRLVWISPLPRVTQPAARQAGLVCRRAEPLDMGGFTAQLEVWLRPANV